MDMDADMEELAGVANRVGRPVFLFARATLRAAALPPVNLGRKHEEGASRHFPSGSTAPLRDDGVPSRVRSQGRELAPSCFFSELAVSTGLCKDAVRRIQALPSALAVSCWLRRAGLPVQRCPRPAGGPKRGACGLRATPSRSTLLYPSPPWDVRASRIGVAVRDSATWPDCPPGLAV